MPRQPEQRHAGLDDEMLRDYWEQGYVVVPGLLPEASLAVWRERLEAIVSGAVPPAPGMLVMKDVMVSRGVVAAAAPREAIAKLQDFENDPVLWGYAEHEALLDCVERIVGREVFGLHSMLINKPPHVDGRHPLHQDLLYFPFRPAERIVAAWTALEVVNRENGCLVVVPGSQRGPLRRHENMQWEHVNAAYWGAEGVGADAARVHLEMRPGDTVFFHPLLLHGSGRNRSPDCRRAISAHFASTSCHFAWRIGADDMRPYKVVRGEGVGRRMTWGRGPQQDVDPMDYLPKGPARAPGSDA
ncbi:MAG: phytanoyl-CoA dioxygenase family protein [Myxococcales bacterium]|nr:phytanoyl-CoA dioxygenase family protein [Myxococcales bacterium]